MRTSTAYFAGAGTVVAAVVAGLGGGLLIANIVSPHSSRQDMTRVERNRSAEPIPVSRAPSEPVPYLAAIEAATKPVVVAPAPNQAQSQPGQQQTEAANNPPAAAQRAEATETPAAQSSPSTSPQAPAPAAQSAAREQGASPENAFAKARDVDVRRAATERRRGERRQQWAEKRRYPPSRNQELRDVDQKVREETEPTQGFAAEPVRVEMPRIRFFDSE
jgi:hypothetical protein